MDNALHGERPDFDAIYNGYVAAVDWPTSLYWREVSAHYPQAPVLLSVRDSAATWWESADATILAVARDPEAWGAGPRNDVVELLRRFTGADDWDARELLMAAYDAHLAAV